MLLINAGRGPKLVNVQRAGKRRKADTRLRTCSNLNHQRIVSEPGRSVLLRDGKVITEEVPGEGVIVLTSKSFQKGRDDRKQGCRRVWHSATADPEIGGQMWFDKPRQGTRKANFVLKDCLEEALQ